MSNLNESFDVFSNALRLLSEQIVALRYFFEEINEPEEGISNLEAAYSNALSTTYGLMCALKDAGACASIYEDDAVTAMLCIRHVLQHQPGRIKNNLRDAWSRSIPARPVLIGFGVSDTDHLGQPFYLNIDWLQEGIRQSNGANRLPAINAFWNFDEIKVRVEQSGNQWRHTYVCAMKLITEAARTIVEKHGHLIDVAGSDSAVYLHHLASISPVNSRDYDIET